MLKDYLDKWEERAKKNTEIIEQQQKKMRKELTLVERYHILKNRNLKEWLTIHYKEPKTHEYMDKHNIPKQR